MSSAKMSKMFGLAGAAFVMLQRSVRRSVVRNVNERFMVSVWKNCDRGMGTEE
jgi:hypothetical protein